MDKQWMRYAGIMLILILTPVLVETSEVVSQQQQEETDAALVEAAYQFREKYPDLFDGAKGVVVLEVVAGSQAKATGLQRGDIVIHYGGQKIDTTDALIQAVQARASDAQVELNYLRAGKKQTVVLKGGSIGIRLANIRLAEFSPAEAFITQFLQAMRAENMEAVYKLLQDNLEIAKGVQQELQELGQKEGGEEARGLAAVLGKLLAFMETVPDPLRLERLLAEGRQAYFVSDYHTALKKFQDALALAQSTPFFLGRVLSDMGTVYTALGQYAKALEYYQQALPIVRQSGDRPGEQVIIANIGLNYNYLAQYEKALNYHQQALAIARELGDQSAIGTDLTNLGVVYRNLSQYEKALEHYQQALAIGREIGDRRLEGNVLGNISGVYANLDQHEKAIDYSQQALRIHQEIDNRGGESDDLGRLGQIYANLGQYKKASDYYQQALTIKQEIGDRDGEGDNLAGLGDLYRNLDEYEQALNYYQQALAIRQKIGSRAGEAHSLNSIGAVYAARGQYDKALEHYQQALAIAREIGDRITESDSLNDIGLVYVDLLQFEKAINYHQQALTIAREIGTRNAEAHSLGNIGVAHVELSQYQKALEHYQKALAIFRGIGDRYSEGNVLGNIGVVYANFGQYQTALNYYQQALAIRRESGDRSGEARDLTNLGNVYWSLGEYDKALTYNQLALPIRRTIGDRRGEGNNLNNIGLIYFDLAQYKKAAEYYLQALGVRREIEDQNGMGITLNNLGGFFFYAHQYEEALSYYQQALAIWQKIGAHQFEGDALHNIGIAYSILGQNKKALDFYGQAFTIFQETGDRPGEAGVLGSMGNLYTDLGQYEKALGYFKESLIVLQAIGGPEILWRVQLGLGKAEAALSQYSESIAYYEQSLDTIESTRTNLKEKETRISYASQRHRYYDELITLLQTLHEKDSTKGYNRKALEIFERKQGRLFLEEIGQSGARRFAGMPTDILQQESNLSVEQTQLQESVAKARARPFLTQDRQQIDALEQRLATIAAEQRALQTRIQTEFPAYFALKYPRPIALSELQEQVLQPDERMLVYGVMQENTVLWVIGKDTFAMIPLNIGEQALQEKINAFRAGPNRISTAIEQGAVLNIKKIAANDLESLALASHTLYQTLLPETVRHFIAQAKILYIVPTGPLYGLPFESLVTRSPTQNETPHYLIQDQAIAYLSSASLLKTLRQAQARRKETIQFPLLAFAHPVYAQSEKTPEARDPGQKDGAMPAGDTVNDMRQRAYQALTGQSFKELPETEQEAKEIANLLIAPAESNPLQLRENASRSNVFRFNEQQRLDDYRYLLFSTHAVLPGEVDQVDQPALVLSHPETEGYLTMGDVFSLQLNADFVMLSACNTGRGESINGEGVIGLTRAFMYAGTPSISVTLWPVESSSARQLSTGLFRYLKAGKPPAEALRQIKLEMLNNNDNTLFRHPYFWAPFVIFGQG